MFPNVSRLRWLPVLPLQNRVGFWWNPGLARDHFQMAQHLIVHSWFRRVDEATRKRFSRGSLLHRFFPPSCIEGKGITDVDGQLEVLHRYSSSPVFVPHYYCHMMGQTYFSDLDYSRSARCYYVPGDWSQPCSGQAESLNSLAWRLLYTTEWQRVR